jgi:hypothetical protein
VAFDDKSLVGEAYRRVARRIRGDLDVPELSLDHDTGMWATFKRWMGLAPSQEVVG